MTFTRYKNAPIYSAIVPGHSVVIYKQASKDWRIRTDGIAHRSSFATLADAKQYATTQAKLMEVM